MDFGDQPISYALSDAKNLSCATFALRLWYCERCGYVFIRDPIDFEQNFRGFQWPTSYSPPEHLGWLAGKIEKLYLDGDEDFILEVGSNDGYFLKIFKDLNYKHLLGVEPSANCAKKASANGIKTLTSYLDKKTVDQIIAKHGKPKVVICRHVIEHIVDPNFFIKNLKLLVDRQSSIIIEVPDFAVTSEKGDFSTIWEQHVSYFTLQTLSILAQRHRFSVQFYKFLEHGGGSLVLFLTADEKGLDIPFDDITHGITFRNRARDNIDRINNLLKSLKDLNKSIAAFGAGSRGMSLINFSGIANYLDFIVDDNAEKVGKFLPNTNLQIVPSDELIRQNPDYCLLLPLSGKEVEHGIMQRYAAYVNYGGVFIELFKENGVKMVTAELLNLL
jgi:hypothetical protein